MVTHLILTGVPLFIVCKIENFECGNFTKLIRYTLEYTHLLKYDHVFTLGIRLIQVHAGKHGFRGI